MTAAEAKTLIEGERVIWRGKTTPPIGGTVTQNDSEAIGINWDGDHRPCAWYRITDRNMGLIERDAVGNSAQQPKEQP